MLSVLTMCSQCVHWVYVSLSPVTGDLICNGNGVEIVWEDKGDGARSMLMLLSMILC